MVSYCMLLKQQSHGKNIDDRRYSAEGSLLKGNDSEFKNGFAIYVGDKVSLAHGVQIHGPAYIGNDTFVGMKSLIFNAKVGKRVAIGVSSTVTDGVTIPDNKFVPPGSLITTQAQADALPARVGSPYEKINSFVFPRKPRTCKRIQRPNYSKIGYRDGRRVRAGRDASNRESNRKSKWNG